MYVQPKALSSLLSSTIPKLPHKCLGVVVVHTDAPHRLHLADSSVAGHAPFLWVDGGESAVPLPAVVKACAM